MQHPFLHFRFSLFSNHNKVLKPTQFKAYLGLEKVSQTKSKDDNTLNKDYAEALVDQIILHPEYVCGKPENDIGWFIQTIY